MCVIAVFRDSPFTFDSRFSYVGSLIFLVVFNSVIAFSVYFALLKRIGAERSAYVTVLFPVVALVISTIFENYQWTLSAVIGVTLTLIGNVLILRNSPRAKVAPTKSKFEHWSLLIRFLVTLSRKERFKSFYRPTKNSIAKPSQKPKIIEPTVSNIIGDEFVGNLRRFLLRNERAMCSIISSLDEPNYY